MDGEIMSLPVGLTFGKQHEVIDGTTVLIPSLCNQSLSAMVAVKGEEDSLGVG